MNRHTAVEARAAQALQLYLALGPQRSLERLSRQGAQLGFKLSLATLKRFSARFAWQRAALAYDKSAADEFHRELVRRERSRRLSQLERVQLIEDRLFQQLIDSFRRKKQRAKTMRVSHYLQLLNLEQLIRTGKPMPRAECVGCRRMQKRLTEHREAGCHI